MLSKYTAHSLRASFVTVAKLAGADDSEVMNQTKHKTPITFSKRAFGKRSHRSRPGVLTVLSHSLV